MRKEAGDTKLDRVVLADSVVCIEDEQFLHVAWNHGVRINAGNARAAMEAVNKVAAGKKYPLLVDMALTNDLNSQAREVFSEPCAASKIALVGAGPVDGILVKYQLSANQVPCPTRFFTSKSEALAWLHEVD